MLNLFQCKAVALCNILKEVLHLFHCKVVALKGSEGGITPFSV